ncbi:MAG: Orange carotenoid protein [Coleofasciculus sp. S288]|nr:Orange carotenoid protein [Coleofasciculus sp. S288]
MPSINLKNDLSQALQAFRHLNVDDQLALLWFVYTKMGGSITPAAPGAAGTEIAENLFNQVKPMSHEEQLQVQRDLLSNADTTLSREYGSLSANTKLLFWYRLAQGMESATIVPMPPNYEMSSEANNLLAALETADFEQQITFLREAVEPTGAEAKSGSAI